MHVLVLRFSAMGDVAMAVPAMHMLLKENPELKITFLSRPFFEPLFQFSDRITFVGADLKGKHKGVLGLRRLASQLSKENDFDAVVDIHDVLRTKTIRTFLKLRKHKIVVFNKGRAEKESLLKGSKFRKLKHSTDRYLGAFKSLGLNITTNSVHYLDYTLSEKPKTHLKDINVSKNIIGIAPFAMHASKEWGLDKIKSLIQKLTSNPDNSILLFGGGEKEVSELSQLEQEFNNCFSVAGKFSFREELELINHLHLMVSMDSANMHLSVACNTPVISIWGATHHYLGFGPLNNEGHIVEVSKEKLPCRPCSVYGKISNQKQQDCADKSMEMISVEMVLEKVNSILK